MVEITEEQIREKLAKHYGKNDPGNLTRKLHRVVNRDDHTQVGSIFWSLDGSPPKGYALYIKAGQMLSLYDVFGKRFAIINFCVIVDKNGKTLVDLFGETKIKSGIACDGD